MTGATDTAAAPSDRSDRPPSQGLWTAVVGVFRDPLRTFVVLAVLIGGTLVVVVPFYGGIDERTHFFRTYQISTGQLVPEEIAGSEFSGYCAPAGLDADVQRYGDAYRSHLEDLAGVKLPEPPPSRTRCPSSSDVPVTFSTFGSPVPYAPQAVAVLVAREMGAGARGMLLAGRITMLAAYVVLVAIAIARSPRAKWALCSTALIPVAVFQSASSLSHDAVTTAVSLLVVSSALRAYDPPAGVTRRQLVVEALLLTTLLALCKPPYVVLAGCYLLALVAAPRRWRDQWPFAAVVGVGVVVTVVWNQMVGHLWRTDAGLFGIRVDPDAQRHELLTAPWDFAVDTVRTVPEQFWDWMKGLFAVGPSVTHWPAIVVAIAVVLFALVAVQRARTEPSAFHWAQRVLLLALFGIGMVMIFAGVYIYWSEPGDDTIGGLQARYFVPMLVLLPLVVGTPNVRWLRSHDARVPLGALLVPFFVLFAVSVAFRMH